MIRSGVVILSAYVVGDWSRYGFTSSNGKTPMYAFMNQPKSEEPNSESMLLTARSEQAVLKRSVWETIHDVM